MHSLKCIRRISFEAKHACLISVCHDLLPLYKDKWFISREKINILYTSQELRVYDCLSRKHVRGMWRFPFAGWCNFSAHVWRSSRVVKRTQRGVWITAFVLYRHFDKCQFPAGSITCHQHSRYLISCGRVFANRIKYRDDLKMLATVMQRHSKGEVDKRHMLYEYIFHAIISFQASHSI